MPTTQFKVVLSNTDRYDLFHSLQLEEKFEKNTLIRKEVKNKRGPINAEGLPEGTISQAIKYIVKGAEWTVAKAHQYKLPDGRIVGGPDPLYMRFDDVVLVREERRKT